MKKDYVYIIGAVAAVVGVFVLLNKRDSIVQVPQIGQVGTAPGPDTTAVELGFKSSVFNTYADLLKTEASLDARTRQLETQASVESQRIAAGLEGLKVQDAGSTARANIWANSDNLRAAQQYELQRSAQNSANAANILRAITQALGSLRPSSGGSGGGSGAPSPTNYPSRRPSIGTPPIAGNNGGFNIPVVLPGGYSGGIWPEGYTPPFVDYGNIFGGYDPFGGSWYDSFPNFGGGGGGGSWYPGESDYPVVSFDNPYPEYGDWGNNFDPVTGDWIGG